MKRKLISMLMSTFAIVLLLGAGVNLEEDSPILTAWAGDSAETTVQYTQAVEAEVGTALEEAEVYDPSADESLLVNGEAVDMGTQKVIVNGVSYVALRAMVAELDETAVVGWEQSTSTITVTSDSLTLTVGQGDSYLVANGRYLQLADGLQVVDGVTMIPLTVLAKAFDATVEWDGTTKTISVTTGSGGIESGDSYYDADDLFWLSRIIFAESGSESLEGKIAVGNVVLNRVANPAYPDTLMGVISQKNQFSTYQSGSLADRTPNETSIIAAKLVLDGAVIAGLETATHFDTGGNTWAARNKTCLAVIGGHKFYG